MFGGLAAAGGKALGGARFNLVNIMPATILVGFVTLLAVSGLYSDDDPKFNEAAATIKENAGAAIIAVFGIFVVAVLLRPFQVALVQVLEGYWQRLPVLNQVAVIAIERHRRARHTAEVIREAATKPDPVNGTHLGDIVRWQRRARRFEAIRQSALNVIDRYPKPRSCEDDRLMPTILGNALRRGEDNAGDRYGLRMQVIWPRMYPSLSPKLDAEISRNLDLLDASAAMCVSFAMATLSSLPLVRRWDVWSLTPLVVAMFSLLAYRGALRVARGHAELLATGIDLHRFDMLAALHYELPTTTEHERKFNIKLSNFLAVPTATALDDMAVTYAHPDPRTPQVPSAPPGAGEPEEGGGDA